MQHVFFVLFLFYRNLFLSILDIQVESWAGVYKTCVYVLVRGYMLNFSLITPHAAPSTHPVLTSTALLGSLSCWIASCQSWGPPTIKCCSSVRWPPSWPLWRTTLPTVTSSTCVWMVRHYGGGQRSNTHRPCLSRERYTSSYICSVS